jgi:N12 class adenine-specific DNA methylase
MYSTVNDKKLLRFKFQMEEDMKEENIMNLTDTITNRKKDQKIRIKAVVELLYNDYSTEEEIESLGVEKEIIDIAKEKIASLSDEDMSFYLYENS